jgi:tetraacyldisaccharide 4'-kinase
VSVREYWEAVVRGDSRGAAASVFAVALRLASLLQWLALHANLAVYRVGLRQRQRLDCPVLVVGNLTLGGTGKTTTTAYLVRRLAERGVRAGVVLRGYGRKIGNVPLLVGDGERILASPEEGGDEAVMLASMLPGHPVAVGLRREQVSRLLRRETGVDVVVLDDGFQ